MTKMIRILGVGNVLMEDDGLGPYAIKILEAEYEFPNHVEIQDVGTPGLDFAPYLDGASVVIVIDTVDSEGDPGTLRRYNKEQLLAKPIPDRTNPHQPGLRETLMVCELTDSSPDDIIIVGVIPESMGNVARLSDTIRGVVPKIIQRVIEELNGLDASPRQRAEPLEPDIWWESS